MQQVVIQPGEIYHQAQRVTDKRDLAERLAYIRSAKNKRDVEFSQIENMAERVRAFGMDRQLHGKMAAKYDGGVEAEVHDWILGVTGIDIGHGMGAVAEALRNGQTLCVFMQTLLNNSNCPPACAGMQLKYNTMTAPFKQMENIEIFLKACELYGVPRTSLFQVVDLYEARNMAGVLSLFLQLGTEAQRHEFQGPSIGPKPTEKHHVEFTEEQLRAGQTVIGLQAGTNKCASQSGMKIGGQRHIADIKIEEMSKGGEAIIGLQAGTNKCASQAGMRIGGQRHIADVLCGEDMDAASNAVIGLQMGTNQGASQSGMSAGPRQIVSHVDDVTAEGQAVIGLQMGTNQVASQAGMTMGKQRHITDF